VFAYVVLKGDRPTGDKLEAFVKTLRDHVTEQLGAIARPDDIRFADNLPKTRSGKIMRRLLRAIARNEDITQDLSTLENPAIIDQLRGNDGVETAAPAAPVKSAAKSKPTAKKTRAKAKKAAPKRPAPAAKRTKPKANAKRPALKKTLAARKHAAPKKKAAKRRAPVRRKK
jgi:hypothetical protein